MIHLFSIVFISWGIVGSIDTVNKIPSKSQAYLLTGKLIKRYKKHPYSGYKRTYDKTRFFVSIQESSNQKEYTIQVNESLYDDMDLNYKMPKIIHDTVSNTFKVDTKNEVSINLKMGWLGIIY
ncbi:MAG: hypothetical protein JNM51_16730 [Bacteroidia bacterium]|nr:hypothetical protein [Bacteroidia bacterium]